jgi:hypothetical protein
MFKRTSSSPNLQSTSADNGGALLVLDAARLGADGLKSGDDIQGGLVSDFAENDVAAIEPRGDDGGDEELGAVGVGASVSHGEQTRLGVLQLEVLVGELLAVDGLATGAVTTGEVTALKHEVRDDSVERRALVTEALLASAESLEVGSGLGNNVIEEVEVDASLLVLDLGGDLAALNDGALPLNVEVNLAVGHCCGC